MARTRLRRFASRGPVFIRPPNSSHCVIESSAGCRWSRPDCPLTSYALRLGVPHRANPPVGFIARWIFGCSWPRIFVVAHFEESPPLQLNLSDGITESSASWPTRYTVHSGGTSAGGSAFFSRSGFQVLRWCQTSFQSLGHRRWEQVFRWRPNRSGLPRQPTFCHPLWLSARTSQGLPSEVIQVPGFPPGYPSPSSLPY